MPNTNRTDTNGRVYSGVSAEDMRPYIQGWIDRGHTLKTLADEAMVAETTLRKIMRGTMELVRDDTADRILTALGLPHVLNQLIPEPPPTQYYED